LNIFNVIGSAKQRTTNVLGTSKAKEQSKECKKRKNDILSQILSLDPLLFLTIISCSFFIHFERFQKLQMRYFKIYNFKKKLKVKKKIVEKFKLQSHTERL
jgi:Na+/melibiose symporter-like transporter